MISASESTLRALDAALVPAATPPTITKRTAGHDLSPGSSLCLSVPANPKPKGISITMAAKAFWIGRSPRASPRACDQKPIQEIRLEDVPPHNKVRPPE